MTHLFGTVCNQPKRLAEALAPVRKALVARGAVPRWGLGYVQAGQVLLSRNPRPEDSGVDFGAAIEKLKSDYIVGWAGREDGLSGTPNTQPFRFRAWIYAQTSTSDHAEADIARARVLEHMPGYLQRNIRGKTLGELTFHLFLSLLHDAGKLGDPDMGADAVREAVRDSVALLGRLAGDAARTSIGSIVACNSRSMVVAHGAGDPLFVRSLRNDDRKLSENQRYRAILAMTSREKPGDGFEAVPPGSAVVIHREVRADITPLSA